MEITEGLYERGQIVNFSQGESALFRNPINYTSSQYDTYHTIIHNENLYDIARQYYGQSFSWFEIADVNPLIEDIFDLPVGETILIPTTHIITKR